MYFGINRPVSIIAGTEDGIGVLTRKYLFGSQDRGIDFGHGSNQDHISIARNKAVSIGLQAPAVFETMQCRHLLPEMVYCGIE